MLEPHGPLPPEIYWRRRVLAAGLALFAVLVVVLLIVFVGGGKDSSQNAAAASSSGAATTSDLPPSQAPDGADASAANNGGGAGGAGGSSAPRSGASQSGSVPASASASGGVPTPGAVVAGGPCPDANISVVVGADKATYTLGEQPTFEATVTNAGPVACQRDIGTGQQQLIVLTLDGSKQLWTNFDCTFQPGIKNEVLQPGQQLRYQLQWAGTTSAPGCQAQRTPVAPGAYQVVAQLGAKRSAPVTFNIVRAAPAPAPDAGTGN